MQTHDGTQRSLPSTYCPFCIDSHKLPLVQTQDTADAFSLSNLIPAGTLSIPVHNGESPCPSGSSSHDWYSIPARNLSTHAADSLFRELSFLIEHLFLRATCRLGATGYTVFIRVYLIPNDLPNVHGKLHSLPKTVVNEGLRCMQVIIPLIEQNDTLWDAGEACLNAPPKQFLPSCAVCRFRVLLDVGVNYFQQDNRTMAEIYSDLPSPTLSPPTNENTAFFHGIASGDAIWGLKATLYGYQRHSVAVMLHKESSARPVLDPSYIAVSCMSGTRCYIQPSTMSVLRECPAYSPPRAGILCEELGEFVPSMEACGLALYQERERRS